MEAGGREAHAQQLRSRMAGMGSPAEDKLLVLLYVLQSNTNPGDYITPCLYFRLFLAIFLSLVHLRPSACSKPILRDLNSFFSLNVTADHMLS